MGKELEVETNRRRCDRRKSLVQVMRPWAVQYQHLFRAEKWVGTVKNNSNYSLLANIPRKLRMKLTMNSLEGKPRWDRQLGYRTNGSTMTHGVEIRIEDGVSKPAIVYLYAMWGTIWVRCGCSACRGNRPPAMPRASWIVPSTLWQRITEFASWRSNVDCTTKQRPGRMTH